MAKTPADKPPRNGKSRPASDFPRGEHAKEIGKLKKRLKKNPQDEEAYVRLWDAFVEAEAWEAAVELLQGRAAVQTDSRERVRTLLKLGALTDEKLGDVRRAVDIYHQVLTLDPQNNRALWALGVLYHDLEDWEKVIEIYLMRIGLAESLEEKLSLRGQLAQIYEQRLQQEDQALVEYIRAARLAPQNVRVLLNMEKLATRTESFRELLAVYEDVVERIERIELRIALYLKLARLYTQHLEDDTTAEGYYRRALELAGEQTEQLFSISRIYGEEEEWQELIATYTQLIRFAEQPQVKSRLRREVARLYSEGLHDPTSAFYELVRVARYNPDQAGLVDELAVLGEQADRQLELAAVLEDIGSRLSEPAARVSLYTRLAALHLKELHNAEQARTVLSRALEIDPSHVSAQLLRFDLLEAGKEFDALAHALESFLARDDVPLPITKEQRKRLARLFETKLGDRDRAVALFRQSLAEPQQADAGAAREEILEQLYRRQGTWEELIKLLLARQADVPDAEGRLAISLEIADLLEHRLEHADRAFFELLRALKQSPTHPRLLDEVFRLGQQAGFTTELQAVVEDLLPAQPDPQAAELHARLGALCEAEGQIGTAVERYRRALSLDTTNTRAYRLLRAWAERGDDWRQVVELDLTRSSKIDDTTEKIELLLQAAELAEDRLHEDGRAADIFERVLHLNAECIPARKGLNRLRGQAAHIALFDEDEPSEYDDGPTDPGSRSDAVAALRLTASRLVIESPAAETLPAQASESDEDRMPTEQRRRDELHLPPPVVRETADAEAAEIVSPPPVRTRGAVRPPAKEKEPAPEPAPEPEDGEDREPTQVSAQRPASGAVAPAGPASPPGPPVSTEAEEDESPESKEPTLVSPPPQAAAPTVEKFESLAERLEPDEPDELPIAPVPDQIAAPPPPTEAIAAPSEPPEPTASVEALADEDFDEVVEEEEAAPLAEEGTAPHGPFDPVAAMWQAARDTPRDVEGWEKLAVLLQEKNDLGSAFDALEEGSSHVEGDDDRHRFYRRMSALASGHELRLRLARLLENRNRLDDAESSYRTVLRSEVSHPEALDGLERIYRQRKALDRYDALLTRSLKNAADGRAKHALLQRRARLRAEIPGRTDDAVADLEQMLAADESDVEALASLEDLLERLGRHDELVRVYERHLPYCLTADERLSLLMALAVLYENSLDAPEQAAVFYRRALAEAPDHLGAIESLVALLEKRRDWLGAIEVLAATAERIGDPAQAAGYLFRRGKLLEEQLLRPEEAEEVYRRAIDGRAPSLEAMAALKGMARRRGDWVEVIRLNKLLLDQAADVGERANLLVEQARVWRERLDNEDKALENYELALQADPDNLEAARVVGELRLKDRRHQEAHRLLAQVAERGADEGMESGDLAALHLKLAQSAEALDRMADAATAYDRALALAPADHAVLTQVGYFLARRGDWQRAVDLYREILDRHRHRMEPNEVADTHCLMAQGYVKLEQPERAVEQYRQALIAHPKHLPALRASIELARVMERWDEVETLLGRLRDMSSSPAARIKLAVQIGDIRADQMRQPDRATDAYHQALEDEPNNIEVLEKLRRVLVHAEQFEEAVRVIERLAHLSPTDRQRARFLRIAGDIERERLDDDGRALDLYLRSLRASPLDKRTHGAAVKILTRMRDWSKLADLTEDLLRRLPPPIAGQQDQRQVLLTDLVELYRFRLEDNRRAISACERLLVLDPGQIKVQEDLARLLEQTGALDRAAELHRSLIAGSPFSVDSYHALRRIYEIQGSRDRTLCMAATLAFLDEANPDEMALLKEYRHALPISPGHRLDEELFQRRVNHPAAAGLLGEMIGFASEVARPLFAVDHREFKLRPREQLDLRQRDNKIAEIFRDALAFLDLPVPEIYGRGLSVKGVLAVNTSPVAVLYSEESLRRSSVAEMRFLIARALAFTRPENLLATSLSAKQIRTLLDAMVELVMPAGSVEEASPEVVALARRLDRAVPGPRRERLRQLASRYREQAEDLSIRDWLEGVEHTCNRAGFVYSGDLEAAVTVLKAARVLSPSGASRSLIRELIFYSISEEYFELRRALGAAI